MKAPLGPIDHPATAGAVSREETEPRVPLRLSVTRGKLGLELYEPKSIGPIVAEQLSLSFLGLKFPLDLSGGVPAFRHRRGNLERAVLATELEQLRHWFEPRFRQTWGPLARPLDIWWNGVGVGFGLVGAAKSIAWEMHWAPLLGSARFIVANARGWGLKQPAIAEVLRLLDSAVGNVCEREGRAVWIRDAGRRLGRFLLPQVGARAPMATDVLFSELSFSDRMIRVELDATAVPLVLGKETLRLAELSELAQPGDDELARGDLEAARNAYLSALEAAPRQRELVLEVADIDLVLGRPEAALGMVSEAMPVLLAGAIGARLLLMNGEKRASAELLGQTARDERYSPLAAMIQLAKSDIVEDVIERRLALDSAVATCPTLECVRWARLESRAKGGDWSGAVADAQYLEASRKGRSLRHEACLRAAMILREQGDESESAKLFQKALRYCPEDVDAMVGLAGCLATAGQGLRAIPLLERAIRIADEKGNCSGHARVELAKLIATKLSDLPQAVARLRSVAFGDSACVSARLLEGRYRFMMGDVLGASLAFARMRDAIELDVSREGVGAHLVEAARFERDVMRDLAAAERHLASALRIMPHQSSVQEFYRDVATALAARRPKPTSEE